MTNCAIRTRPSCRVSCLGSLLSLFFLLVPAAVADTFSGTVIGIQDGDTIEVRRSGEPVRLRIFGIDCPELKGGQAYGHTAKQFTSKLCYGKTARVREISTDRYGRVIATVQCEGKDLGSELVAAGLALVGTSTLLLMPPRSRNCRNRHRNRRKAFGSLPTRSLLGSGAESTSSFLSLCDCVSGLLSPS